MKKWTDDFLARCLDGIPAGEYRTQLQRELEDHLLTLAAELEADGQSPEDAHTHAISLMGAPTELNAACQKRFAQRQLRDPFYILGRFFSLALRTGIYYLITFLALNSLGFTPDSSFPDRVSYPLYGHPERQLFYGGTLFLVSFSLNALHLRQTFRLHPSPGLMILSGLLFTWLCEKTGLFTLCSVLGGNSMMDILLGGWADAAPWLNFPYVLLSFFGCFLLSALFAPHRHPGGDHL